MSECINGRFQFINKRFKNKKALFRGKEKKHGEWIYGYYCPCSFGRFPFRDAIISKSEMEKGAWCPTEVYSGTITESTGFEDKNGNEIFEGDIIRFGKRNLVVFYNDESFQWQAKEKEYPYLHFDAHETNWDCIDLGWIAVETVIFERTSTEIIGNIFDNEDLIPWLCGYDKSNERLVYDF